MTTTTCTIPLFSLKPSISLNVFISQLTKEDHIILLSGISHGWIHKPQHQDADVLLAHDWHLFLLTLTPLGEPAVVTESKSWAPSGLQTPEAVIAYVAIEVAIPYEQFEKLEADLKAAANSSPSLSNWSDLFVLPELPSEWTDQSTGYFQIPERYMQPTVDLYPNNHQTTQSTPAVTPAVPRGTLRLNSSLTHFLSTALPAKVQQAPVSLFNIFKYRNGNPAIHDLYKDSFAANFGDTAGAKVKFMGKLESDLRGKGEEVGGYESHDGQRGGWQDANLVHYDTLYHYAYMLSTDVYQGLNRDKVRGLEDTGILLVSEAEVFHG